MLGGGNFWMGAGQGLIVTAFNFLAHKEATAIEENNIDGDCPTCPKNAKNGDVYTENSFSILERDTWNNFGKSKTYGNVTHMLVKYYYIENQ